jgi:hypothetical protein
MHDRECPFCRTTINPGAIVCTGCGAYKSRSGEGNRLEPLLWIAWAIFGPVLVVSVLIGKGFLDQYGSVVQFLIGAAVSVLGWMLLKKLFDREEWRLRK